MMQFPLVTDRPPRRGEGRGSPTNLVVDDEPDVRDVVVEVLRAAQYDVDEPTESAEPLDCLGRQPYDLVVSDLSMPRQR